MSGVLAVENLSFAYPRGREELFASLSHQFRAGHVTAITGPSGRGKSTLLYLLGLLLRPTAGRVLIDGVPGESLPDVARSRLRASRIGFVFQDAALDPSRTVLDAVVEPALYAGARRRDVLARASRLLTEFGVRARVDHRPGEISGGQAQRVALCRCLMNDPVIVLADEPTGNLDPDNAVLVLDALRGAAGEGRTVVIATHDPSVLKRVDDVLSLGGTG